MPLTLKVKKLHPDAVMPRYEREGDAAFELFSTETIAIKPGERCSVPTGLALEIPYGYVGLIYDKSGLAHKHGLKGMGGVIDAGYRGEVFCGIINLSNEPYVLEKGHKIAQMIIHERPDVSFVEVTELSNSERGDRGFGSTGK